MAKPRKNVKVELDQEDLIKFNKLIEIAKSGFPPIELIIMINNMEVKIN